MDEGLIEKALSQLAIDVSELQRLFQEQKMIANSLKCKACYWYEDKIWECGTTPERCVECEKNDYCSFAERD